MSRTTLACPQPVTAIRLANGSRASYTYDAADQLTLLANLKSDGTTISSFSYSLDNAGNRTGVTEANGDVVTWTYDAFYQLTRERRSGANAYDVTYTYDAAGNRETKVDSGAVTTYTYDVAHELLTEEDAGGVTTYTYDQKGNTHTKETPANEVTTYTWDDENRLVGIAYPGGNADTFTYLGDGKRASKEDSDGLSKHIWDGENILIDADTNWATEALYTLEPEFFGNLVSQRRGGASYWHHFDGLGSTDRLTDSSEVAQNSEIFRAFGESQAATINVVNPFRYVGQLGYVTTGASSLLYVRARYLRPPAGRWISRDPLVIRGMPGSAEASCDPYRYANNSAVTLIDPAGAAAEKKPKPKPKPPVDPKKVAQCLAKCTKDCHGKTGNDHTYCFYTCFGKCVGLKVFKQNCPKVLCHSVFHQAPWWGYCQPSNDPCNPQEWQRLPHSDICGDCCWMKFLCEMLFAKTTVQIVGADTRLKLCLCDCRIGT